MVSIRDTKTYSHGKQQGGRPQVTAFPGAEGEPTTYEVPVFVPSQAFVLFFTESKLKVFPLDRGMTTDMFHDVIDHDITPWAHDELGDDWILWVDAASSHGPQREVGRG